MSALCRRAFFNPGPIATEPSTNQGFITFGSPMRRQLQAPAQSLEQPIEIIGMIHHAKVSFDHLLDAPERPAVSAETCAQGAPFQSAQQCFLLIARELSGATSGPALPQLAQAALLEAFGPGADRGAADAESARDVGLGE